MTNQAPCLPPGFRFHPTDEELILHYLRKRAASSGPCPVPIIAELNIYQFDPWELPERAMFGDKEWYFFSPRDRKYPNGVRPNRAAASGYWKATGTDKPIVTSDGTEIIGAKKVLVFYKGKPPRGIKTNWIMHEYRLSESKSECSIRPMKLRDSSMRLDDWVLYRIYQKSSSHLSEDSAGTESPVSDTHNSTTTTQDDDNLRIHKSFSLSELLNEADFSLLSRLLEAPNETEMPANLNQPFINMHQYLETEPSSISVAENSLKRQREERGNLFLAQKKSNNNNNNNNNSWAYTNFANQFDTQAFFNQQLLLNSQLGMQ